MASLVVGPRLLMEESEVREMKRFHLRAVTNPLMDEPHLRLGAAPAGAAATPIITITSMLTGPTSTYQNPLLIQILAIIITATRMKKREWLSEHLLDQPAFWGDLRLLKRRLLLRTHHLQRIIITTITTIIIMANVL